MQPRQIAPQQRQLAGGQKPARGAVRSRARQEVERERRAARPRSCWRQSAIRAKLSRPRELTRGARERPGVIALERDRPRGEDPGAVTSDAGDPRRVVVGAAQLSLVSDRSRARTDASSPPGARARRDVHRACAAASSSTCSTASQRPPARHRTAATPPAATAASDRAPGARRQTRPSAAARCRVRAARTE